MTDAKNLSDLHGEAVKKVLALMVDLTGRDPATAYSVLETAQQHVRFALVNNMSNALQAHAKKQKASMKKCKENPK